MVRLVRYANCTYFLLLMLIDTRRERISLHLLWKFGPSINTTAQYNKIKHSCTRTHFLSKREFACLYYPICVREYVLLVINSFAAYDRMMYLTLMRQTHQVQNDCITNFRLKYKFQFKSRIPYCCLKATSVPTKYILHITLCQIHF